MKTHLGAGIMKRLTLEEIIALEPEVGRILREAKGEARRKDNQDDLYRWYKGLLSRLVGWYSPHKELRDQECYETAIKALCEALDY